MEEDAGEQISLDNNWGNFSLDLGKQGIETIDRGLHEYFDREVVQMSYLNDKERIWLGSSA